MKQARPWFLAIVLAGMATLTALPQDPPTKAVTYQKVKEYMEIGLPIPKIIEQLQKSPTKFVLGEAEEQELRKLGATDALIAAMKSGGGALAGTLTDLAIILDCSNSMNEKTVDGVTKMTTAKKVVANLIDNLPNHLRVTFIIYGHDAELKCDAVKVVRELAPLDAEAKAQLREIVAGLAAKGHTPIAKSLVLAGAELAKRTDAACGLVLITDGIETCHGDPAAEAAKLTKRFNLKFGVRVIGFGLNTEEKKAVKRIADEGHGEFYPADNAKGLTEAIEKVSKAVEVAKIDPPAEEPKEHRSRSEADEEDSDVPSVKFVEPAGFPKMKRIGIVQHDGYGPMSAYYKPHWEVAKYGQEKRKPADGTKFDLWFEAEGHMPVLMTSAFSFKEGKLLKFRPERHLSFVRFEGKGLEKPKAIGLVKPNDYGPDSAYYSPIQTATAFAKDMLVPVGKYDLWNQPLDGKPEKIKAGLVVEPGKVTVIK